METLSMVLQETRPKCTEHKSLSFSYLGNASTPLLRSFTKRLLNELASCGHKYDAAPHNSTNAVLCTADFGDVVGWRQAPLFSLRSRFALERSPITITIMHVTEEVLKGLLDHLQKVLEKPNPDPEDYDYPGLVKGAYRILHEQGRRGGAILALIRLLQAQTKSIRIVLLVGEDSPDGAYIFDLVGSHPYTSNNNESCFYHEIARKIISTVDTQELTDHIFTAKCISHDLWSSLDTPREMCEAACEFGSRGLFSQMVRIKDLIRVPAVSDSLAAQYSEGCFATWDTNLSAMITTVSGSTRPATKGNISDDDLVIACGIRPNGRGAIVQPVEGNKHGIPSSEVAEMLLIDAALPTIVLNDQECSASVPVVRSKLHIHRGIRSFDERYIEYAPLPIRFQKYLVSCATNAQAFAVTEAFSNSRSLRSPSDPRQLVFTVLPGHGIIILEKWMAGERPFQLIFKYIDSGKLEIENTLPQGPLEYYRARNNRMVLTSY